MWPRRLVQCVFQGRLAGRKSVSISMQETTNGPSHMHELSTFHTRLGLCLGVENAAFRLRGAHADITFVCSSF